MTHIGTHQPPQTTGKLWDGDVQEFNNPIPRWWLWACYVALACALFYWLWGGSGWWGEPAALATAQTGSAYSAATDPRTASNPGPVFKADSDDPIVSATKPRDATAATLSGAAPSASLSPALPTVPWAKAHQHYLEAVATTDYDAIVAVPGMRAFANSVGRGLYGDHCAGCHGQGGSGIHGLYPSLTDDVWLRGKSYQAITASIRDGHPNIVPGFAQRFSAAEIKFLAVFVHQVGVETGTSGYQSSRIKTRM